MAAGSDEAIWTWTRKPVEEPEEKPGKDAPPRTDVLETEAGLNKHSWDLAYPPMDRFENLILWIDARSGPMAVPGEYVARLDVGGDVSEASFNVIADPRSSMTPADYEAQFNFAIDARNLLSDAHNNITRLREVRAQLEGLQGRVEEDSELATSIAATLEKLTAIEEALYQTKNESRQDPLNFPIRLNNKLSYIMLLAANSEAAPTAAMIAVRDELATKINGTADRAGCRRRHRYSGDQSASFGNGPDRHRNWKLIRTWSTP